MLHNIFDFNKESHYGQFFFHTFITHNLQKSVINVYVQ
jgi:hypothetical protein